MMWYFWRDTDTGGVRRHHYIGRCSWGLCKSQMHCWHCCCKQSHSKVNDCNVCKMRDVIVIIFMFYDLAHLSIIPQSIILK